MKRLASVIGAAGLFALSQAAWSQSLDLSSLDKFAAKAKEANVVTIPHDQLQAALGFMGGNGDKEAKNNLKTMMMSLDSIVVRNYEFAEPGLVTDADLDSVRAQIAKLHGCNAIVDSKSKKEHSQIFVCSQDGKNTGFIVLDVEPKELNFVWVKGSVSLSDLGKLDGMFGLPKVGTNAAPHRNGKADESKDDDDD